MWNRESFRKSGIEKRMESVYKREVCNVWMERSTLCVEGRKISEGWSEETFTNVIGNILLATTSCCRSLIQPSSYILHISHSMYWHKPISYPLHIPHTHPSGPLIKRHEHSANCTINIFLSWSVRLFFLSRPFSVYIVQCIVMVTLVRQYAYCPIRHREASENIIGFSPIRHYL